MLLETMQWGASVPSVYFFDDLRAVVRPDGLPSLAEAMRDRPTDSEEKTSGFDREVRLKADANGHFVFQNGRQRAPGKLRG
jgi:hypothetical protein